MDGAVQLLRWGVDPGSTESPAVLAAVRGFQLADGFSKKQMQRGASGGGPQKVEKNAMRGPDGWKKLYVEVFKKGGIKAWAFPSKTKGKTKTSQRLE